MQTIRYMGEMDPVVVSTRMAERSVERRGLCSSWWHLKQHMWAARVACCTTNEALAKQHYEAASRNSCRENYSVSVRACR